MGKWMKKGFIFLLIVLSLPLFGDIKSMKGEKAVWKEKEGLIEFTGNVEVIDTDFSLKGDEIKVRMKNGKFLEMSGENIEVIKGKENIKADTFIFHPEEKLMYVGGNVKVERNKTFLESERGVINMENGTISLAGKVKASFK